MEKQKREVQEQEDSFGKRLVNARNKKGYSQEKFANELGVSRQMVSKWELNSAVPRMSRIDKICEVLEIDANELVRDKEDENSDDKDRENQKDDVKEIILAQNNLLQQIQKASQPVADKISINFKTLVKGMAVFLVILMVLLLITYLSMSIYKLVTLSRISSKVEKYANLDNYYCKVRSFDDNGVQSIVEIWYKDGIYKIVDITNQNNQEVKSTRILNLNDNSRCRLNDEEMTVIKKDLPQYEEYVDGRYMYELFPSILRKEDSNYGKISFGFNSFSYSTEDDMICININDEFIYLDNQTYLPLSRAMSTNKKQRKLSQKFNKYYEIALDSVEDKDVAIPEGYTIIER